MSDMDHISGIEAYLDGVAPRFSRYIENHSSSPQTGIEVTPDVVSMGEWLVNDPEQFLPVDMVLIGVSHDPDESDHPDNGRSYGLEFSWQGQHAFSIILSRKFFITDDEKYKNMDDDRVTNILNRLEKLESSGHMCRLV